MDEEQFFNLYMKHYEERRPISNHDLRAPITEREMAGDIGIELELEGEGLPTEGYIEITAGLKSMAFWRAIKDGSLRGGGREYVLSAPCYLEEVSPLVYSLWRTFNTSGSIINNSNRCSTHVHVNVSGLKINSLTSIVALWYTFERAIIQWCGEERIRNHFCLPLEDSASTLEAWERFLKSGERPGENIKYSALNVLPLWRQGSFEFRCGPAADTPELAIYFATFIKTFVDYAVEKYPNPVQIAYAVSEQEPSEIFKEICGRAGLEKLYDEVYHEGFNRERLEDFRNVQELVYGVRWEEWIQEINKPFVVNPFAKKVKKQRVIQDIPPPVGLGAHSFTF